MMSGVMVPKSNHLSRVFAGYVVLTFVLAGLTFLQNGRLHWFGADLHTKTRISHLIGEKLPVGTSSTEIEKFFSDLNISHSYHNTRSGSDSGLLLSYYSGMIQNVAHNPYMNQKVKIKIYVDESKSFVGAEVSNIYTAW